MRVLFAAAMTAAILCGAPACAQPAQQGSATAYMAQNALADGVHTLPFGVQYKVVRSGPADGAHPTPDDLVKVNYEGSLVTGQVFDSSYKSGKPVTFKLKSLIPGWVEGLQQMRSGDEWMLYVPPSMGYGAEQAGPIPPNSVLVFKLELLAVGDAAGPETH